MKLPKLHAILEKGYRKDAGVTASFVTNNVIQALRAR